ncbi:hypothetical protein ERO13_A04G067828v2 [Gossypium hirsutum]|uniref:Uncharacterized protein n=3 Tax=Gossypium TaxID=3633 RepID=A0A5J5W3R0_GOSBA|nr:hypothetical protein ES319_A04G086400v1 [Gossypium barbadense]KAG4204891.1 hypothetical protein ERO13_A04G067828v2 [Gossypium hirsutum]TYH22076.1 hypothetical protein ES288_A04G097900v1 [Gossypium darwinii]TYI32964.1 hypothetical protein ES332_A04G098800v1 [Gossypium tomentosum]
MCVVVADSFYSNASKGFGLGNIKVWVWRYVVISISWQITLSQCRPQVFPSPPKHNLPCQAKDQQNKFTNSWSIDQRNKVGADGPLRLLDIKENINCLLDT